jgi:orotidine-5'-phosphate decarboxylase
LVVGATAPDELAAIRAIAPGLAFLVPGVGAQGGDEAAVLRDGPARHGSAAARSGGGLLVNVSRGIAGAAMEERGGAATANATQADPGERIAAAARDWARRLRVLR